MPLLHLPITKLSKQTNRVVSKIDQQRIDISLESDFGETDWGDDKGVDGCE